MLAGAASKDLSQLGKLAWVGVSSSDRGKQTYIMCTSAFFATYPSFPNSRVGEIVGHYIKQNRTPPNTVARERRATKESLRQHARKAKNPYQRSHMSEQPERDTEMPRSRSERRSHGSGGYFASTGTTDMTYDVRDSSTVASGRGSSSATNTKETGASRGKVLRIPREHFDQRLKMMGIERKKKPAAPETEQTGAEDADSLERNEVSTEQHDEVASSKDGDESDVEESLRSDEGGMDNEDTEEWDGESVMDLLREQLDSFDLEQRDHSSSQPRKFGGFKDHNTWTA